MTVVLIFGVGYTIYDSAKKRQLVSDHPGHSNIKKNESVSNVESTQLKKHLNKLPDNERHLVTPVIQGGRGDDVIIIRQRSLRTGEKPKQKLNIDTKSIKTGSAIFKDLGDDVKVHVIGVYEGEVPEGVDDSPWWSNCVGDLAGADNATECHRRFASLPNPEGVIDVDLSYEKKSVLLVLMSYDPVLWKIKMTKKVDLAGVVLGGYHGQRVSGVPEDTKVVAYTNDTSDCGKCFRGSGYFFAYKQADKRYQAAMNNIYEITGRVPDSFQGVYRSGKFSVSNLLD